MSTATKILALVAMLAVGVSAQMAEARALPDAHGQATGRAARDSDRAPSVTARDSDRAPSVIARDSDRAPASLAWVRQKGKVEVGGLKLTLADVAEVDALDATAAAQLRALDLGVIPAKGRQLVISRETIVEAVAAAKLKDEIKWDGANVTQVDLQLFTLSGDEVESLGRRYIAHALGGAEARFGTASPPHGFECVAGRWSTRVFVRAAPNERFSGAVRLEIVAVADGVERAAAPFVVEIAREGRVLVATRDLTAGTPVKSEDVSAVQRNLSAVGPDSVEAPERLIGMVLARRVPAGQVLTTRDVRFPPVIERDDVIQVRYRAGALKVTSLGKAQAAGAPGERIAVTNLSSGKVVHAIVVDSRTVEVASGFTDP